MKVRNKGERGLFKAQFQLTSEDDCVSQLPLYEGHWRLANKGETEIMKDQDDMIQVAESVMSQTHNSFSICLNIFFHDESTKSKRFIQTSSYWVDAYITDKNGNYKRPMTKWDYYLQLSLSSSPSLVEGAYNRRYRLNVDGLEEVSSVSSIPDKEDSRP